MISGKPTKVLFVCNAGVARSPMAVEVLLELGGEHRYWARAAGVATGAARRLTTRDLAWADVVAVLEAAHRELIQRQWPRHAGKVRVLGVADEYDPGEAELRALLRTKIRALVDEAR